MIDKNMEPYYDAILSIFVGVISILLLHRMYNMPRIIVIESLDKNRIKSNCCDLNMKF